MSREARVSAGASPLVRVRVARGDGERTTALMQEVESRLHLRTPSGEGPLPEYEVGERLGLERPVVDDAMYVLSARVVEVRDDGSFVLEAWGDRERQQQRDHVRVSPRSLEMTLREVPEDDRDEPVEHRARVLDLSAGGARVEHRGHPLAEGTPLVVEAALQLQNGQVVRLSVRALVRWSTVKDPGFDTTTLPQEDQDDPDAPWRAAYAGVQFDRMRPMMEERVTQWVFQQQAREIRLRKQQ